MSALKGIIGKGGTTFGKGGLFNPEKVKTPKIPELEPEAELVQVIEESAEAVRRRQRKKLSRGGPRQTVLGGIASALKRRLGE